MKIAGVNLAPAIFSLMTCAAEYFLGKKRGVRFVAHEQVTDIAVKSLAQQIQMFKADPRCNLMVKFVDSVGPDTCHPRYVSLRQPPFPQES